MAIIWEISVTDHALILAITSRYCTRFPQADFTDVEMDYTACHCNGNPLDLEAFFAADDFNFLHDACGIRDNLDRKTGRLMNHFSPRFSRN